MLGKERVSKMCVCVSCCFPLRLPSLSFPRGLYADASICRQIECIKRAETDELKAAHLGKEVRPTRGPTLLFRLLELKAHNPLRLAALSAPNHGARFLKQLYLVPGGSARSASPPVQLAPAVQEIYVSWLLSCNVEVGI
jgi:hypothetical protein